MSNAMLKRKLSTNSILLLIAMFVSNIGNGAQTLALSLILFQKTHSLQGFGIVLISEMIFKIILQFHSGILAERLNPIQICRFADAIRSICIISAFFLLTNNYFAFPMLLIILSINVLKPYYISACFTLATKINEKDALPLFNSIFSVVRLSGGLIGTAIFGSILTYVSNEKIILINGVTYLISFVLLLFVKLSIKSEQNAFWKTFNPNFFLKDWASFYNFIKQNSHVYKLTFISSNDAIITTFISLVLVPQTSIVYGNKWISITQIMFLCGAGLSTLIFSICDNVSKLFEDHMRYISILKITLLLQLISFVVLAFTPNTITMLFVYFIIGITTNFSFSLNYSKLQTLCAKEQRGKLSSFYLLLTSMLCSIIIVITNYIFKQSIRFSFVPIIITIIIFILIVSKFLKKKEKVI